MTGPEVTARPTARPTAPGRAAPGQREPTSPPHSRSEVHLVGRVSGTPEQRELPSGDVLVSWRLVVHRPPSTRRVPEGVRTPTVDTLSCVAWTASLRRTASGLAPGDVVEVTGAVRQRFWKAGHGLAGRTEVEAQTLRRLARAG